MIKYYVKFTTGVRVEFPTALQIGQIVTYTTPTSTIEETISGSKADLSNRIIEYTTS